MNLRSDLIIFVSIVRQPPISTLFPYTTLFRSLLALTLGGRRVLERVRAAGRGPVVQRVMGAVMLATALLIVTNVDVSFDQLVARRIPNVNLTAGVERSDVVARRLRDLHPRTAGG